MAFCFKRKESVPKAIRRLGRERVEDALECLKDCGHGEAIHCARKDIKKVRALLRLVRSAIDKKEFRRLTKFLREMAKRLAEPRDAYVKVKTLTDLMRRFKGQLAPGALRHIRVELRNAFQDEMKRFTKNKIPKAIERLLLRAAKELKHLEVKGTGWIVLSPGVKAAYADGRHAYQIALKDSLPENFHEWRKHAKALWYQVTLLRRVLRQTVQEMCAGEHHPRELEALNGLIEQRQRELRAAALAIGARFYDETPSAFCKRLAGYWKIWCREKKPAVRLAEAAS